MEGGPILVRADSWELPALAPNPQLLKTVSSPQEPPFLGCGPAAQAPPQAPACPPPTAGGRPPLAPGAAGALSTASTLTGARPAGEAAAPSQLLLPMRQISLDAITAADLCKPEGVPDRSSIFNDVIEQLAAKEESLPVQTGLYTLPSIQFLESLLEDMDSKSASTGHGPVDPPLYLPLDAFDLPFEEPAARPQPLLRPLGPSPFDLPQPHHHHATGAPHHAGHHHLQQQHSGQGAQVYHITAAATRLEPVAQPAPHAHGFIPTSNSMPVLTRPSGYQGSSQLPHCRSAGPSPTKPVRRAASAYGAFEYEMEPEVSLQPSKSGRMRKVSSFAGAKRKQSGELCGPRPDAHHLLHPGHITNTVSESDTGATTLDDESDDEVSKGSKASRRPGAAAMKKGGKRTTCLNCGCHQTPQWRCGPLGPRTLCNACGVRYKKGLPLNCWPIREGMVLPPGAVLPPGVHIPGVILQPAEDE